jgi:hypothetical protein
MLAPTGTITVQKARTDFKKRREEQRCLAGGGARTRLEDVLDPLLEEVLEGGGQLPLLDLEVEVVLAVEDGELDLPARENAGRVLLGAPLSERQVAEVEEDQLASLVTRQP